MPRTSKKELALLAALDIVEETGTVTAVTYDSLAAATGMTKSGLIYHFPDRHSLLCDMHSYCAKRWEAELEEIAGGSAETLENTDRYLALVHSLGKNDPLVELLMSIHAQTHADFRAPWNHVESRWMPDPSAPVDTDTEFRTLLATVLSTGLWVYDHISETHLSSANRDKIMHYIAEELIKKGG